MFLEHFREVVLNPIPCEEVKRAPAQEVIQKHPIDIEKFANLTHNEHDSGAYITAGLVIARDP